MKPVAAATDRDVQQRPWAARFRPVSEGGSRELRNTMDQSDEEIVSRVLAGSSGDFAILLQRYQRPVYNLMFRYCRSEQEAADLTQEVFLRAYEKLGSFRPGHSFFSWLYTLACNRAGDWYRKNGRRIRHEQEMRLENENSPSVHLSGQERELERKQQLALVETLLERLPHRTREILLLRYRQERPIKEIATIFHCSESAVKMRISRGLQQLQDMMAGSSPGSRKT